ncbi:MAG: penicillin-binding transpeptidase domain-containing protein [Eubacteriales bacterium]
MRFRKYFAKKPKKLYNMRMIKKCFALAAIAVLVFLSSCSSLGLGNGAQSAGVGFAQAVANRDYSAAYDYLYKNSNDLGSRDEFVQRFTNIMNALEITDIKLGSHSVTPKGQLSDLKYTLTMKSTLMGNISYEYEADIIPDLKGFAVMYTPSLILPYLESGDTVRIQTEYGQRGEIFDKNKELLAKNDFAQSVYLDTNQETKKLTDINVAAQTLNSVLGVDAADVIAKYNNAVKNNLNTAVIKALPKNTLTDEQKKKLTAVPGIGIDETSLSPIRYYPMLDDFAHVIGYMGSPSEDQIKSMASKGVTKDSKIGQTGLEAAYEDALRPSNGFKITVQDSLGNEKKVLFEKPKQDGEDIVTTLDAKTQNKAYTLLAENVKPGENGAVVVMDYKTGNVESLVSYPSFNPNAFSFPMDPKVWTYLNSDAAGKPLINRATQAAYPPGSAFKPFSITPVLEAGKITPETVPNLNIVNNTWIPDIPGWVYPSINRTAETLGTFNMMNAMKSSDNIFYAWAALQLGIDPFMNYMEKIGMGDAPKFELPIKSSNLINKNTKMNIKYLADMGYGMGELLVTPVQLASMYTAIMNNGDILNPTVVSSIYQTNGNVYSKIWQNQRTVFKPGIMKTSTIDTLMQALHLVVDSGTAYPAKLEGVNMVGKTGTAQIGNDKSREINWIVLMGLDKGNEKLVLVMLDTPKDQGKAKFTIASNLMKPDGYDLAHPSASASPSAAN